MSDSGEYYRITCRFCDTILTVTPEQVETEVKCPDCFSILEVGKLTKKRKSKPIGRGGRSHKPGKSGVSEDSLGGDELKLSETFERPPISPLFGLEASQEDLLAPRKRKSADEADADLDAEAESPPSKIKSSQPKKKPSAKPKSVSASSDYDQDLELELDEPLPVDDVLSLESIGTLVPDSEPGADEVVVAKPRTGAKVAPRKKKRSRRESAAPQEAKVRRPDFKPANLFMATVGMLSDVRVLGASACAILIMLIGGFSSEAIFPAGSETESLTIMESMSKYFTSFLFGCVPYYIGLLGLWTVAGFVFRDAVQGHAKFQGWTSGGQASFWPTFLLFGFSFFIAGLPGAILSVLIVPLRMMIAPLFLISAWFNGSPWQIISADWYHVVSENKSQWITVYSCFAALALAGLMVGSVFLTRRYSDLLAVDLILTAIGIGMNTVITLVFAAIAGWHAGAVIESIEQNG